MHLKTIEAYLKELGVDDNLFFGQLELKEGHPYGFFQNVISKNGKLLLNPDNGRREAVWVSPNILQANGLKNSINYQFSIKFSPDEVRKHPDRAYTCMLDYSKPINKLTINRFEKIIQDRYNRLDRPDSNRIIASLLDEIGKGMYSSKKRMIFELLQNADDVPAAGEVKFYIEAYNDYLLIAHNGLPFNEDDVKSITSAAESTKQKKQSKTGYKGIGFKSVFTDSNEVIIKSGGFFFEFNKNSPLFRDFDAFYFNRAEYKRYPQLLEEKKEQFSDSKKTFRGILDIPWQLLPLGIKDVPIALRGSKFMYNNNVGIALRLGLQKVHEYSKEIQNLCADGRFLLFLRNTSLFQFTSAEKMVQKEKKADQEVILIRERQRGYENTRVYKVREFEGIEVNDTAFKQFDIPLQKKIDEVTIDEKVPYFVDSTGNRITAIPPKIAAFEKTSISFAAPIIDGQIQCEPSFIKKRSFSYFFTYLPMKENRIEFPFLVNADFVPSSNREEIQGDNHWNEYIFANIGYKVVEWVAELASMSNLKYLSLLPPKLYDQSDTDILLLTQKFNEYYLKSIKETPFILNDLQLKVHCKDIILDNTGFATILGYDAFYDLLGQEKRLPAVGIDTSVLEKPLFEIEKFTNVQFIEEVSSVEGKYTLESIIARTSAEDYPQFLNWLNKLLKAEGPLITRTDYWNQLKFIRFVDKGIVKHFSWQELQGQTDYLLIHDGNKVIQEILSALGFILSEFNLDRYIAIKALLAINNTYLSSSVETFKLIQAKCPDSQMNPEEKVRLAQFLYQLPQIGPVSVGKELLLFEDIHGNKRSLCHLLSRVPADESIFLSPFLIKPEEGEELVTELTQLLCKNQEVYSKLIVNPNTLEEIKQGVSTNHLSAFYAFINKYYHLDSSEQKANLETLPIIYVDEASGFSKLDEVYYSSTLTSFKAQYVRIKDSCEALTGLIFPHLKAVEFIAANHMRYEPKNISEQIFRSAIIETDDSKALLEFLAQSKGAERLFDKGYFEYVEGSVQFKLHSEIRQYYTKDRVLEQYLQELEHPMLKALPPSLSTVDNLGKMGLLENEQLVHWLLSTQCPFKLSFAQYIRNQSTETKIEWIKSVPKLVLSSKEYYPLGCDVDVFMRMVVDLAFHPGMVLADLRKKIYIDGIALSDIAYRDEVDINYADQVYTFSLAKLLPMDDTHTDKIASLVQNLNGLPLGESLFELESRSPEDVANSINKVYSELVNEAQYVFLSIHAMAEPNEVKPNDPSVNLWSEVLEFCFKQRKNYGNTYPALENFISSLGNFNPHHYLFPSQYAYSNEILPKWVEKWIKREETEDRILFLQKLGLNASNSPICTIRKFFLEAIATEIPETEIITVQKRFPDFLQNTINWLATNENNIDINTAPRLSAIYMILSRIEPDSSLPIPLIIGLSGSTPIVRLKVIEPNHKLIQFNSIPQEHRAAIYNDFQGRSGYYFIQETFPESWNGGRSFNDSWNFITFKVQLYDLVDSIDLDLLAQKAKPYNETLYKTWDLKDQYPIFLIQGKIPKLSSFNDFIINRFEEGDYELINGQLYINAEEIDRIDRIIKDKFFDGYHNWLDHKSETIQKAKERGPQEYDRLTEAEAEQLKEIFGNNLPKEQWQQKNLSALIKGLNYLSNQGWEVEEAAANLINTYTKSYLAPVYKNSLVTERPFKVFCQSATGGLLYLRHYTWEKLEEEDFCLYVSLSNDPEDCKFCQSKQELLDPDADYFVVRFEGSQTPQAIDGFLKGQLPADSKLRIILRSKKGAGFKSIFEKIREKELHDNLDDVLLATEHNDLI